MMKIFKWFGISVASLAALALIGAVGVAWWFVGSVQSGFTPPPSPEGAPSILSYASRDVRTPNTNAAPLEPRIIDWSRLANPPQDAQAWTRWWWPGGAVDAEAACEQLNALHLSGFGGVEIQPFRAGLNQAQDEQTQFRINSFGSETYYATLSSVLTCADDVDMAVYLNHLSGWPAGGPEVLLEDGLYAFASAETEVRGGRLVTKRLPTPKPGFNAYIMALGERIFGADLANFVAEDAQLISVVAAHPVDGSRASNPLDVTDTISLDPASVIVLDDMVTDGELRWDAPAGDWLVIAVYLMPSGEAPTLVAQDRTGFVIDHLRSEYVRAHYEFAYGDQTGLPAHYGAAFRGFFNDSLEFKLDRLATQGILEEFEARRGYDLRPHLPAIFVDATDNYFIRDVGLIYANPTYHLSDDDGRIRRDYQETLSDLLIERFVETSADWAKARGLLSRGQSYGVEFDIIRALGANDIPETEQLFGGGSEMFMKLASSAGALYDRPLISAESFVWPKRAYAIAPRQIKAAADALFISGINQIIYHGVPYQSSEAPFEDTYGALGWYPFSGPENSSHFSNNYGPNSANWAALPELNRYIARTQNLLQAGTPDIDVFVYYPYLGFPHSIEESETVQDAFLFRGVMPGEPLPPAEGGYDIPFASIPPRMPDERLVWLEQLTPLLDDLNRRGVTWAWINDHALQTRPDVFSSPDGAPAYTPPTLVVANVDAMPLETVIALEQLASNVPLTFVGDTPTRQPGLHHAASHDPAVARRVAVLAASSTSSAHAPIAGANHASVLLNGDGAIRRVSRRLPEGRSIHLLANQSVAANTTTLSLTRFDEEDQLTWFDPLSGAAWRAEATPRGQLELSLGPLDSRVLIVGDAPIPLTGPPLSVAHATSDRRDLPANAWSLRFGDTERPLGARFLDLRDDDELRFAQGPFVYETTFEVSQDALDREWVLDLGLVEGVASVSVNGAPTVRVAVDPFLLDISQLIQAGANTLEIEVRPPLRNELVGRALEGDLYTLQMLDFEEELSAAGLIGPVALLSAQPLEPTDVGDTE